MKAINTLAEQPLVNKYGKNWRAKFSRELRVVTASPERAINLIASEDLISELENHGDSIFYHFNPTRYHGIYDVDIVGYQNKEWVSFFNYKVNYFDQQVTLKRKTIKTDPAYLSNNLYFDRSHYRVIPR